MFVNGGSPATGCQIASAAGRAPADSSAGLRMTDIDGVKIDLDEGWVHMRKSNTEPIIRVYAEATTADSANQLADRYIQRIAQWHSKSS